MRGMMGNIKDGLRDTWLYRYIISAVFHPKNFFFLNKYPFWKPCNVWDGRFLGYAHTMYDWIPDGWRKAFGESLSWDIAEALRADNIKKKDWAKNVYWTDIKEKYGTLRLYATTTERVQQVLSKYECASYCYCINCGKPVRYVTNGYISFICEDCYEKGFYSEYDADRLTKEDIPVYYTYKDGKEESYTPLERWGIDFKEMWGLK